MKILYLGDDHPFSTSRQRADALVRLGHKVEHHHPHDFIPPWYWLARINVRTGYRLFSRRIHQGLAARLQNSTWDLVWIDSAAELPPSFYLWLRAKGRPVVSYVLDNPFVPRDHRKWDLYKKSLSLQDLTVFPREESRAAAAKHGAPRPVYLYQSYDPVAHHPDRASGVDPGNGGVVFVGTWMPGRGEVMVSLARKGLPLVIHGNDWPRAPEWPALRRCWAGPSIYGADYVRAIRGARIALGLLSKGNQDLHTTRSVEIPFMGGAVFCAERTPVHQALYREGEEAFFWEDPRECAEICLKLWGEPETCRSVSAAGREKVMRMGLSNDEVLAGILRLVSGGPFSRQGRPAQP